ncbi:exosortase K [Kordia jejudonensis]|uniref:exosortase K n=1 Tax=Kordia jejudonensis TaxID=1348245 RepID=UPI0009E1BE41|nr:exosortase K [Kordia jejudonensis]
MKKTIFKLSFLLLLVLALKAVYSASTLEQLRYFMLPMIPFIELFSQTTFQWIPEVGYSSPLHIVIEKSCAGGNFFIICFAFLSFKMWKFQPFLQFLFRIFLVGICSYFIMIFANTARIVSAIKLTEWKVTETFIDPKTAHLALGCILYILILLFMNHFISSNYAKVQTT